MPNVVKFSGGGTPAIPGPAEKTVPAGSSSSLSRGIDSSLSGLMDCHPSKPTQDSSETLVASAPPRRTLAKTPVGGTHLGAHQRFRHTVAI